MTIDLDCHQCREGLVRVQEIARTAAEMMDDYSNFDEMYIL